VLTREGWRFQARRSGLFFRSWDVCQNESILQDKHDAVKLTDAEKGGNGEGLLTNLHKREIQI
jgi:hypothetical protein